MSLRTKKKSGPSVPPMDAGTYPAVLVGVVDLGTQYDQVYKRSIEKILLTWEIPSQRIEKDGKDMPRWMSNDYTNSLGEKSALHKMMVSWRGRPFTEEELSEDEDGCTRFQPMDMLGEGCLLQVIQEDKKDGGKKNKITSVVGLPAGMEAPKPENPFTVFDTDNWDDEVFDSLLDWIKDRIKKSAEYQKLHAPEVTVDFPEETGTQTRRAESSRPTHESADKEVNPI